MITIRPKRLVFLHGFSQTHHHWHAVAHAIAAATGADDVAFLDLPGHGLSTDDTTSIDLAGSAIATLGGPAVYVGYSMGGRYALATALAAPELVERLVVIGATPGIGDDGERAARRTSDAALAARIEQIGVDAFVDEWLAAPMFAGLPHDPRDLEHRRRNTAGGLAASLVTGGTGQQTPMWDRLHELSMPVLALAGARDEKFAEIARHMTAVIPHGRCVAIADAGHAAHIEQPAATIEVIVDWMRT